ncbi:SOS response-associated peptidase family protein [Mesorhizobium sp. M1252]|uniref:SOS response-associated peptidase family protein n=1 Tax=Mesorhizobium sp. M1252 TaxID=2957073 RepID=UPI00333DC736
MASSSASASALFPVVSNASAASQLREGRWWLVPFWAKEMPKAAMFNARIEGIDTAPAFRDAFKSKRCLIPADGFYEWTISPADGKKDPWHIYQPRPRAFLVRRPLGLQFQSRHNQLHHHHKACRRPDEAVA